MSDLSRISSRQVKAFDLFCSVGGLTYGLQRAGVNVTGGLDVDESCKFAYEKNCKAEFIASDIKNIQFSDISVFLEDSRTRILVGCAPCQPFSTHATKIKKAEQDSRWGLISEFLRLIREGKPEIVSMENVPALKNQTVYLDFKRELEKLGYKVSADIVSCQNFGIPQRRRRLVLMASLLGEINLPQPLDSSVVTVKSAIGHLEKLSHGKSSKSDLLHTCSALSSINLQRIRASIPGGTWSDWPKKLLPNCYKRSSGSSYGSVYGRMDWNKPAPTLTTQFIRYGTGRFGHPEQNRALSLREGAILQTFPEDYEFFQAGKKPALTSIARQIGNAVPPLLGKAIGIAIVNHLRQVNGTA